MAHKHKLNKYAYPNINIHDPKVIKGEHPNFHDPKVYNRLHTGCFKQNEPTLQMKQNTKRTKKVTSS